MTTPEIVIHEVLDTLKAAQMGAKQLGSDLALCKILSEIRFARGSGKEVLIYIPLLIYSQQHAGKGNLIKSIMAWPM